MQTFRTLFVTTILLLREAKETPKVIPYTVSQRVARALPTNLFSGALTISVPGQVEVSNVPETYFYDTTTGVREYCLPTEYKTAAAKKGYQIMDQWSNQRDSYDTFIKGRHI